MSIHDTRWAVLNKESAQDEIQAMEDGWLSRAGPSPVLSLDMASWRMSSYFKGWASHHNIKLHVAPKEAHHMFGMLERNHTVRREQLDIYHDQTPNDDLKSAVLVTCAQRNRLRGVRGSTPALIELGQWVSCHDKRAMRTTLGFRTPVISSTMI